MVKIGIKKKYNNKTSGLKSQYDSKSMLLIIYEPILPKTIPKELAQNEINPNSIKKEFLMVLFFTPIIFSLNILFFCKFI